WADSRNVRFRGPALEKVTEALDALDHLRIERFPDVSVQPALRLGQESDSLAIRRAAPVRPPRGLPLKVRFRMRTGPEQQLRFLTHEGRLAAELSTRPGNRFGLHADAIRWVKALQGLPA